MADYLYETIHDIVQELENKPCSENGNTNLWKAIVTQIAERDCLDGSYLTIIQDLISSYLGKLCDEGKISIWEETESFLNNKVDSQYIPYHIDMDLEVELLDEITRYAWDEVKKGLENDRNCT